MVGFALIMIIVAVILLIFLGLSLNNSQKEAVESYEVESFLQATLQYTTNCEDYLGYLTIKEIVFDCSEGRTCLNEKNSCEVLKNTLEKLVEESWKIGEDRPVKGYDLQINSNEQELLSFTKGNQTSNSKGSLQDLTKSGNQIEIYFTAYY